MGKLEVARVVGVGCILVIMVLAPGCGGGSSGGGGSSSEPDVGADGQTPAEDTNTGQHVPPDVADMDGGDVNPGGGGVPAGDTGGTETVFKIAGARLLLAQNDAVETVKPSSQKPTEDGRTLYTYRIAGEPEDGAVYASKAYGPEGEEGEEDVAAPTNLLAVDEEGNAWPAIESEYPIKIMYSVTDPSGEYVYLALDNGWWGEWDGNDYTQFIARENCAFFRVRLEDDTWEPVMEGVFVQKIDQDYMQRISSNQKPIQFDDYGNVFFAGTEFERESETWEWYEWNDETQQEEVVTHTDYWIRDTSWNPRIYRMDKDSGEIAAITQDIQTVDYFLVLPTGEIAYHSFDQHGGTNDRLWMWQSGTTIDLSSSAMGNWGVDFFTVDTSNVVMWGEWNTNGIWFARPRSAGGVEKAVLDTNLFGGNQHGDSKPRRVIVADDGRLYGLFESHLWDHEKQQDCTVLSVYQILPYDGVPKLELTLSNNWFWWDWMRETPFQMSKGYLYYVDTIDPGDYLGTRDVIKMVYLPDRTMSQVLDGEGQRYEIYNWRLSGDTLYFSALDKATTTVVSGEIDTVKVKDGEPASEFLTVTETASAIGAVSRIRDIEILTPKQPEVDTGSAPAVQEFHTSPENLYSVSMDFTKYMDKQTVEDNLVFEDAALNPIESMKVWIYKSLHLIPDLDETGLGDSSTTSPLAFETEYTVALGDGVKDAYGWYLGGEGRSATFTTKPENGWYHSPETDCSIAAISSGGAAKYAGPQAEWSKEAFGLGAEVPANVRIEFSAKNYRWEGINIVLWNKTEWADNDNNDNWESVVAHLRLGNWSNIDYKTRRVENTWEEWRWNEEAQQDEWVTHTEYWYEGSWKDGNTPKLFNGEWMRYRVDFYADKIRLHYLENETAGWTEVESFAVDDLMVRIPNHHHTLLLRVTDPLVIDNLEISSLTAEGTIADIGGDIMYLDFTDGVNVDDTDVPGDGRGFDDNLNDALYFNNW
jgi:hypothetical protein